ncbi:hypothetical protein M5K25_013683 [Dendrobium thyrsiflorum]|uniref:Uncharacterized protein n=1 Tax=Dendrobium thyrsiflorum TaxID=117978 RepID=A0ABD0V0G9_DENTH
MGDPASTTIPPAKGDCPAIQHEVLKKPHKVGKADDVVSTITGNSLIIFRKKFHFPNDFVIKVPAKSDLACAPPPGFLTVYEFSLRAGLRFPPASELIDILRIYGVSLSQLSYRAMSIIMGLIEKWGKLKDLPIPLHTEEDDLLKMLNLPDFDNLHYEVRYLSRYVDEEYLFKVGLFIQAGRSHAHMLKKSAKVPEHISPFKSHIIEDVLKHQCVGRRRAEELLMKRMNLEIEMTKALNDWNNEFVKVKYLQGEYKKKYDTKIKEMKLDRLHIDLVDAHATINQYAKDQKTLEEKIAATEDENKKLQSLLSKKEIRSQSEQSPSRVIEEFKRFIAFKMIIQDQIQEARDHIYDVEVKALEQECMEEGFVRDFLKGVRLVHRKTGAEVEGLTPNQASGDSSSDSDGDEIESELQKAFNLEDDTDIEILANNVVSTITGNSLIIFRKNFHFPNDLVMKVQAKSYRACAPPPELLTFASGATISPASELIDILRICGVSLSQLSYRAMSIIMGLIVFFRDRGAVLSPVCLSRMGRLISDTQGRISFRSRWLDIRTRDPSKSWVSDFFFVQND